MRKTSAIFAIALLFVGCKSKKAAENLPKDIALKPVYESTDKDLIYMQSLRKEIDERIVSETCTDPALWRISAIGSKPCGGPSAYIAYPIKFEDELLPKIKRYSQLQSDYNRKKGLMSDCALVSQPAGIVCRNGKAELISTTSSAAK